MHRILDEVTEALEKINGVSVDKMDTIYYFHIHAPHGRRTRDRIQHLMHSFNERLGGRITVDIIREDVTPSRSGGSEPPPWGAMGGIAQPNTGIASSPGQERLRTSPDTSSDPF